MMNQEGVSHFSSVIFIHCYETIYVVSESGVKMVAKRCFIITTVCIPTNLGFPGSMLEWQNTDLRHLLVLRLSSYHTGAEHLC